MLGQRRVRSAPIFLSRCTLDVVRAPASPPARPPPPPPPSDVRCLLRARSFEMQAKVKRLEEQHSDFSGRAQQHDAGRGNLLGAEQPRLAIPGIPSASGLPATDVDNRQAARPDVKMSEAAQASDAKADDDLRLSVDVMGNRLDRTVQIFVSHVGSVSERDILYHALLSILSEMVITQLANVRCIQRTAPNSNIQQLRGAHGQDAAGQTTASASTIDNARDGDKDGIKYNITLLLSPSYNHSIAALKVRILHDHHGWTGPASVFRLERSSDGVRAFAK